MVLTILLEGLSSAGSAKQIHSAIFTSQGSVSFGRPGEKSHSAKSRNLPGQVSAVSTTALLESLSSVGSANHVYCLYQSSAFV